MRFNESQIRAAKLLEKVSFIYHNYYLDDEVYKEQFKDSYKALIVFLKKYAYERQGAAAAYSKIAYRCVSERYHDGAIWSVPTEEDAKDLWKDYKNMARKDFNLVDTEGRTKGEKIKINELRNPMSEDGGVIDTLASKEISNIAVYVRDFVTSGKTYEAHKFIISIRGIGEKIASFYLRDTIYLAGLNEESITDLYLLQPIDTWLEQALEILFVHEAPRKMQEKQKLIADLTKESEVSSISFNQGAWVLGSQIAREFETFKKALTEPDFLQSLIEKHIIENEKYLREAKGVLDSLHCTSFSGR